jgi:hypothetical protein
VSDLDRYYRTIWADRPDRFSFFSTWWRANHRLNGYLPLRFKEPRLLWRKQEIWIEWEVKIALSDAESAGFAGLA